MNPASKLSGRFLFTALMVCLGAIVFAAFQRPRFHYGASFTGITFHPERRYAAVGLSWCDGWSLDPNYMGPVHTDDGTNFIKGNRTIPKPVFRYADFRKMFADGGGK